MQQGRFASAGFADNGEPLAPTHAERELIENNDLRASGSVDFAERIRPDRTFCAQTPAFTFRLEQPRSTGDCRTPEAFVNRDSSPLLLSSAHGYFFRRGERRVGFSRVSSTSDWAVGSEGIAGRARIWQFCAVVALRIVGLRMWRFSCYLSIHFRYLVENSIS